VDALGLLAFLPFFLSFFGSWYFKPAYPSLTENLWISNLYPVSTLELLPGGSFYGLTARNCGQCVVLTQTDREHSDACRDNVSDFISQYFFVGRKQMQWRLDTSVNVADILNPDVRASR